MTDPDERRAEPPRTKRFNDPEAEVVWPAILMLPEAAKHELARRLGEHLAIAEDRTTPQGERVARAVTALREALTRHHAGGGTGPLSVEAFRALRACHPDHGWPPDASIRRWLGGSWNDALRRARLETVPGGDVLTIRPGGMFTADEVVAAATACADELGVIPSLGIYIAWARRPDVLSRPGRRPMSQAAFDRLWPGGGWSGCLRAAGLIGDGPDGLPAVDGLARPSAYRFTPAQVEAALQACAKDVGGSPRSTQYIAWRQSRLAADPSRPLPSYNVISRLTGGSWDDALEACGLPRLGGRRTGSAGRILRRSRKPRFDDPTLLSLLREAYEAKGEPFTSTAYKQWRSEQQVRDRAERRLRALPSYDVFWKRFGDWETARRTALGEERDAA